MPWLHVDGRVSEVTTNDILSIVTRNAVTEIARVDRRAEFQR